MATLASLSREGALAHGRLLVREIRDLLAKAKARPDAPRVRLALGDYEGHPFRGNQHSDGGGGGELTQERFKTRENETTSSLQDAATARVAARLDVPRAALEALAKEEGIPLSGDHQDDQRKVVGTFVRAWAGSSGGPAVEAMARAVVAERLGGQAYRERDESAASKAYMADHPDVASALGGIGTAMYDETQAWLKERGITEVPLVRSGAQGSDRLHTSWSTSWAGARHETGRPVIRETVPAKYIWSVPSTGFGTLAESEVVVLPRPGKVSLGDYEGHPFRGNQHSGGLASEYTGTDTNPEKFARSEADRVRAEGQGSPRPFHVVDTPLQIAKVRVADLGREVPPQVRHRAGVEREVPISELRTPQDYVSPAAVARHAESPGDKLPLVVEINGEKVIADGSHRVAAAWARGDTTVRVRDVGSNVLKGDERLSDEERLNKVFHHATHRDKLALLLGDFEGHPFRGNQHTDAEAEGASFPKSATIAVGGRHVAVERSPYSVKRRETLVPVDVDKFNEAWAKDVGFHIDAQGSNKIGQRLERVEEFLKTAPSMRASEVTVRDNGTVVFSDGRHRFAFLRDQGVKRVPVSMDRASLKNAKKHGLISRQDLSHREHLALLLGDFEGHPFRGNQYSDGGSGGGSADRVRTPTMAKLAEKLADPSRQNPSRDASTAFLRDVHDQHFQDLGYTKAETEEFHERLRAHTLDQSQVEADADIEANLGTDSRFGQYLSDRIEAEEFMVSQMAAHADRQRDASLAEARADHAANARLGISIYNPEYDGDEEEWFHDYYKTYQFDRQRDDNKDPTVYRRGGLGKTVLSTSSNPSGAQTGWMAGSTGSTLKPTHEWKVSELRQHGYRPIAGLSSLFGYVGEGEALFVRAPEKKALSNDPINLPNIADVSFPTLIGAIPAKPKEKKRKRVVYKGVSLSRRPMRFEVQVLNLTEIPRRLDAARESLVACGDDETILRETMQDLATYGAREVLGELVRQGAPVRLAEHPVDFDVEPVCASVLADRARALLLLREDYDARLLRRRLPADRRASLAQSLTDGRREGILKRFAARAVNEAFAFGRASAIQELRRTRVPLEFELAYRDETGKFISPAEAASGGEAIVDAVIQTAIMDTGTCEECGEVDGEVMELGSDRQEELRPPYVKCAGGERCRCVQIALLSDGTEIDVDEIDEDTIE